MEFGTILNRDLLDPLVSEATWIVGQGVLRADIPTTEDIAAFIAPAPLVAAAPDAVALD
ncbi:hypothetical protein [Paracoccus nototheniae]|nr:hypothetical protein [Paracoccus nototheniae]